MKRIIILGILFFASTIDAYINYNQWIYIKQIKKEQNCNYNKKIDEFIWKNYYKYALQKSYDFKWRHYYKCKNININDITSWSQKGLLLSINKYNYSKNTKFSNFADKYILGELHTGLTNQFPISKIPKYKRRIKNNISKENNIYIKDYYKISSINENNYFKKNKYNEIWEKINLFDSKTKRIFLLKFDCELNVKRSNKVIGELMCYSEENIRKILNKNIKYLVN